MFNELKVEAVGQVPRVGEEAPSAEPKVIACIPTFNDETRIARIIVETAKHVSNILVCDDASDDATKEMAEALGAVVIRNNVTMGYSMSLSRLLSEALKLGADYVITLDAEGVHDPSEIPRFIEASKMDGVDIGIGCESTAAESGRGVKVINSLTDVRGAIATDSQSDFRVYSNRALSALDFDGFVMGDRVEILQRARDMDLRIGEIPITMIIEDSPLPEPVLQGEEKGVDPRVSVDRVMRLVTDHPLLLFVTPGGAALLGSAALWVYALKQFIEIGYLSTIAVLLGTGSGTLGLVLLFGGLLLWGARNRIVAPPEAAETEEPIQ